MDTKMLYEDSIRWMEDLLQKNICDFSCAYNAIINSLDSHLLFSITSRELGLLERVNKYSNREIRNVLAQLCKKLAIEFKYQVIDANGSEDVDFFILRGREKIGYHLSMQEKTMPNIEHAVASGMTKHCIIVPKNNLLSFLPNSAKYRSYPYKNLTSCITLQHYFDTISPGEFEIYKEYIKRFNYDAEMMLGLVVSPIPTQKAIQKKRKKIIDEFDSFFFKSAIPKSFTVEELGYLKKRFQESGILQIPSASFLDSFVSSEWYYDLYVSNDGEMEQTAIVAGYLKAIEQFLFALMLSRCSDLKFTLRTKGEGNYVELTRENQDSLLSMANNLLGSIDYNYQNALDKVYVNEIIGYAVQDYLHGFFSNSRNGYFHKDNIYTFEQIKSIRENAYCALFLLGSAFLFDINEVNLVLTEE